MSFLNRFLIVFFSLSFLRSSTTGLPDDLNNLISKTASSITDKANNLINKTESSIIDDTNNLISKTVSFGCLNPIDPNFLKVCQLAIFPPNTNLTGSVSLTSSKELLFKTFFPNYSLATLSKAYLTKPIQTLLRLFELDTLSLKNSEVDVIFGLQNQSLRFISTVSIFGLQIVTVDILVKRTGIVSPSMLFSTNLPTSILPDILEYFFHVDLSFLYGIFNSNLNFSMVFSNGFDFGPLPDLKPSYLFNLANWQGLGLNLHTNVVLTTGANKISKFLRKFIGSAAKLMKMNIDFNLFNASVEVSDLKINSGLTLTNAGVRIIITTDNVPTAYLEAQMVLQVNDYVLIFDGKLAFTDFNASMQFAMNDVWVGAFGIDRLAFGNLLLTGAITYGGIPSSFYCGAEIAIGKDCFNKQTFVGDGHCIKATGYVGMDIINSINNFFYLTVSSLTLQTIVRSLFGSATSTGLDVPEILNNALQFPKGLTMAYALTDHILPNLILKAGYIFQGEISIFGAVAALNLEWDKEFHLKAEFYCSPINLGGVFKLVGISSNDGPYFYLEAGMKPPVFKANIQAKITVLGISDSVNVNFASDRLFFELGGALFGGLLEAFRGLSEAVRSQGLARVTRGQLERQQGYCMISTGGRVD